MDTNVFPLKSKNRNQICPCGSGKKFKKCCWERISTDSPPEDFAPLEPGSFEMEKERMLNAMDALFENGDMEFEEIRNLIVNKTLNEASEEMRKLLPPGKRKEMQASDEIDSLLQEAEATASVRKSVAIVQTILSKDPDCAEAFMILAAKTAKTLHEVVSQLERAVQAAERKLGSKRFEEAKGHFWGATETRPYMRARHLLAGSLWEIGRKQEALKHLRGMLELNPNDNQGVRYTALNWLLYMGDLTSAEALLKQYGDDIGLEFVYGRALLMFIAEGDTAKANAALKVALDRNPLAVPFLLDPELLPVEQPDAYSFGSMEEAVGFAQGAVEVWQNLPYAALWLESRAGKKPKRR